MKKKRNTSLDINNLKEDIYFEENLLENSLKFKTTWGLFSPKAIDDGTILLLKNLKLKNKEEVLDLGCGYGPIGLSIAKKYPESNCLMVDKDFVAVDYAKKNAKLNNIENVSVLLSNGLDSIPDQQKFSTVVTNLPAKTNKENYFIFFYDIFESLNFEGVFFVVAINNLRKFISKSLMEIFGNYTKVKQGKTYTVSMAIKRDRD
tara:strand:- start:20557 stop:21168 length:612 start_codon:yes stop_codon:yes gene_type:complete